MTVSVCSPDRLVDGGLLVLWAWIFIVSDGRGTALGSIKAAYHVDDAQQGDVRFVDRDRNRAVHRGDDALLCRLADHPAADELDVCSRISADDQPEVDDPRDRDPVPIRRKPPHRNNRA